MTTGRRLLMLQAAVRPGGENRGRRQPIECRSRRSRLWEACSLVSADYVMRRVAQRLTVSSKCAEVDRADGHSVVCMLTNLQRELLDVGGHQQNPLKNTRRLTARPAGSSRSCMGLPGKKALSTKRENLGAFLRLCDRHFSTGSSRAIMSTTL